MKDVDEKKDDVVDEKDWVDVFTTWCKNWIKEFIDDHPYVFAGFIGCQFFALGLGIVIQSLAAYFITIGVLIVVLALFAHEG